MNPPTATLRRARVDDLAVLLDWSPSRELLHQWSGPSSRWPTTPECLWEDINNPDATSFTLTGPEREVFGFGQIRYRERQYGHLARIIVNPTERGRGLGRRLCLELMRVAPDLHPIIGYSLYVWRDNANALALYRSLGFTENATHPNFPTMLLMTAPLAYRTQLDANSSLSS
jgi:[ribosomal protein S18]-alanine N-acetyltransferase